MAMKFDGVAESSAEYDADIEYDYEHRCAEHEHDSRTDDTPEPWMRKPGCVVQWRMPPRESMAILSDGSKRRLTSPSDLPQRVYHVRTV
jgi:hypothetical protein